jgi:hypothetical protein
MRHFWIVPAALYLAVKDMSREDRANALGVPPERVPTEPVTESPGAISAYEAYVSRHNDALRVGYCVDNEAYKARNMKDELNSVARAIMATCKEGAEPDTLASVLRYRNCAAGNK